MKNLVTGAASALLAFLAGSAAAYTPPNFDQRAHAERTAPKIRDAARHPAVRAAHEQPRFLWADRNASTDLPLSPMSAGARAGAVARDALAKAAPGFELRAVEQIFRGLCAVCSRASTSAGSAPSSLT